MAKRFVALAATVFFGLTLASDVLAETPASYNIGETARGARFADQGNYLLDVPSRSGLSYNRGGIDTIYWGNVDASGVAVPGGVWDFEGGPLGNLQGWQSTDLTDLLQTLGVIPVRRVTSGTFSDPRDTDGTITAGGSTASVWFGALDAETQPGCWPGGQGYSNSWGLNMSRLYTYDGNGDVTIDIDYFADSETQFDYSYVYVINNDGIQSPVLNSSANGRPEDGLGWSGAVGEGTAIGSPSAPAHETINVNGALVQAGAGNDFEVLINFDSDPLYCDGLDSFAGFLNSVNGPLGVDNITLQSVTPDNDLSDFETPGAGGTDLGDGWTAFIDPAIGNQMKVADLSALDPVGDPCGCPLSGNVLVASVIDLSDFPHPKKQNESLESPPAYVENDIRLFRHVEFDAWLDLPTTNGVGFRIGMQYYPWTCPVTLVTGWTIEPLDQGGGFFFQNVPQCGQIIQDNTPGLPTNVDSLKVVFELLGDCDDFGTQDCTGPQQTGQSPYWDNVRLGTSGDPGAPVIAIDVLYQDVYPNNPASPGGANTLLPNATAIVHSRNDNNRADMDVTNANMGDSAVVVAGQEPLTEVYLNFRVFPGPMTNTGAAWFSEYGGDFVADANSGAQDNWAKARMDTAEVGGGTQVILGSYSTYDWPNGQEGFSKIIEDGVLTPGSTVEFFFTSNFSITPNDQAFSPDTSNASYFEFEVLPGYFADAGARGGDSGVLAPCLLYVDAFNNGAQVPIEDKALSNLLGQVVDADGRAQDNWDRYDYQGAGGNTPGPLARESNGDNGMTGYQSMIYKTIIYNTGTLSQEGLRDGDAALLQNFLVSDDFNRQAIQKGLWLSGDSMGNILNRTDRVINNQLLGAFAEATLVCNQYREAGCTQAVNGDSTLCVRLTNDAGSDFPQSAGYAARGNGCPNLLNFDVLSETGDGNGNLNYIDQDDGGTVTQFASISNDQFAPGNPANYGVVLDGFSVHILRTVPTDWMGSDCGDDSTAVLTRATDVLGFLNADLGPGTCDPDPLITATPGASDSAPVAFTRLFQNSPNPFNPQTTVRYQLHDKALVKLQIFDVSGKLVRTLVDNVQELGQYAITWDGTADGGREVSSGVYWARMSTSLGFSSSTKMVVLK